MLPVITILVIAVTTKRTLFAMTCGLAMAAMILGKGPKGFAGSFFDNIYAAFSNESLQWLLIVIALFGILIMLYEKTGAVTDFGYWAGKFIKTRKTALFGTFILGVVIFIDDYLNNLAVGTTMKGITDKLGIPRQQLAYVVNTVAAPVCLADTALIMGCIFRSTDGRSGCRDQRFFDGCIYPWSAAGILCVVRSHHMYPPDPGCYDLRSDL